MNLKEKMNKEGGFTIIEVVLVLAIAGLIFLIVFLALPQLQRNRRDTQRRSDTGRAIAALESFAQNNQGSYPNNMEISSGDWANAYLTVDGSVFGDPQTGMYVIATTGEPSAAGEMTVEAGMTCEGSGNSRDFVVKVFVEEGTVYCQDNR